MFRMFDISKDGYLTVEEIRTGFTQLAQTLRTDKADIEDLLQKKCQILNIDELDVEGILKSADLDGYGRLDFSEFVTAAYPKNLLLTHENLIKVYRMLDVDEEGTFIKQDIIRLFDGENID